MALLFTMAPRKSPPPPGYYVPAVLFFDQNEELDVIAIKAHILRLAQVSSEICCSECPASSISSPGRRNGHPSSRF